MSEVEKLVSQRLKVGDKVQIWAEVTRVWPDVGDGKEVRLRILGHQGQKLDGPLIDVQEAALAADRAGGALPDKGETSDGYHTFNELYEHRHALFSVVCAAHDGWKSKLHGDGTMFRGWFIAGVATPKGQATYHLPLSWWDRYRCKELEHAPEWDGHTAQQVPERIASLAASRPETEGVRELADNWARLAAEWDAEDRARFDGPVSLYMHSVRVQVLTQCFRALRAALQSRAGERER